MTEVLADGAEQRVLPGIPVKAGASSIRARGLAGSGSA